MDYELGTSSSEQSIDLLYSDGWNEILSAPDAIDYQIWLEDFSAMTREAFSHTSDKPDWIDDAEQLRLRWQGAIELVADATIDAEDKSSMTQAEMVETGLLTLQANLESLEWEEEGLRFIIPNIFTGEPVEIDLRDLPAVRNT